MIGKFMRKQPNNPNQPQLIKRKMEKMAPGNRTPKLVSDEEMIDSALKEAGKIMVTAFEMLQASGKVKADLVSGNKKYVITFEEVKTS
jgi:hypothetical protein